MGYHHVQISSADRLGKITKNGNQQAGTEGAMELAENDLPDMASHLLSRSSRALTPGHPSTSDLEDVGGAIGREVNR